MRKTGLFLFSVVFALGSVQADEMSFPKLIPAEIPGAPMLGEPFLVMAGDKPVLTEKHGLAAPALWDWDGDGRRDLLVGEFETNMPPEFPMGADGSTIRVYLNVGTDSDPRFIEEFEWARDIEGKIMEVPQWCCIGFTPMFYDLDADGYLDMITGQYHPGEVTWFKGSGNGFLSGQTLPQQGNPASNGLPEFGNYDGEPGDIGTFEYWVYSSATFGDLDDDGDYDLIVGGSGGLRVSENIGGPSTPSFAERELLLDVNGDPLRTRDYTETQLQYAQGGTRLAPSADGKPNPLAVDWDQDGVLDLLVTDSYRSPNSRAVSFFRGVKTPDGHRFEPGIDLLPAQGGAKAIPGSGQRVYVDDWNRDGVNDLIIGASVATVNGGEFSDELSWEWEDVNRVESAGKDPGLYPPQPRPTLELKRAMYQEIAAERAAEGRTIQIPSDEDILKNLSFEQEYWDKEIGRLYESGKEYWLTMRHQGRVYVMLGRKDAGPGPMIATDTAPDHGGPAARITESSAPEASAPPFSPVSIRVDPLIVLEEGGSVDVNVYLDMQDGWYIYAPTARNVGQGMKETSVTFNAAEGLKKSGAAKMPPYGFKGSYDIYSGKGVTWGQPVEAGAGTLPGLYEVSAEVTYQTCNDDLCLLPTTETIVARVLVQ